MCTGKTRSKINTGRGSSSSNTLCNFVAQFGQGLLGQKGRKRGGEEEGKTEKQQGSVERESECFGKGKHTLSDDMCGSEKYFHIM